MQNDLSDDIRDYSFSLAPELIAQNPSPTRDHARLLVVRRNPQLGLPRFEDLKIIDLPSLIASEGALKGPLFLRNRSRVMKARFYAQRKTGSKHEIVLIKEKSPGIWNALVRNQAKISFPEELEIIGAENATCIVSAEGEVDFRQTARPVAQILEEVGEMPLPPYISARDAKRDTERYQSVWADPDKTLSAAAPTASLHFTQQLLDNLNKRGGLFADLYLHVGLGTFEPLRQPFLSQHQLHSESLEVPGETLRVLRTVLARENDKRPPVICVGTTAMRALESLSLFNEPAREGVTLVEGPAGIRGETSLFIKPGFEFRYADSLLTNFHLPESTLFVLFSTFLGSRQLAQEIYAHAIQKRYRFFSYGDATLVI